MMQKGQIVTNDPFEEEFDEVNSLYDNCLRKNENINPVMSGHDLHMHAKGSKSEQTERNFNYGVIEPLSLSNEDDGQNDKVEQAFSAVVEKYPHENDVVTVVLDCANIGHAFSCDSVGSVSLFSVPAVVEAVNYFENRNVKVVGFVPQSYHSKRPNDGTRGNACMQTDDWEALDTLIRRNIVVRVPPGTNDDEYILEFSKNNNAFIVSNDFFTDHIKKVTEQSTAACMRDWIHLCRCSFLFVDNKFMINPDSLLAQTLHLHRLLPIEPARSCVWCDPTSDSSAIDIDPPEPLVMDDIETERLCMWSLSNTIELFRAAGRPQLSSLQHLLHARALLYMKGNQEAEASIDIHEMMNIEMNERR